MWCIATHMPLKLVLHQWLLGWQGSLLSSKCQLERVSPWATILKSSKKGMTWYRTYAQVIISNMSVSLMFVHIPWRFHGFSNWRRRFIAYSVSDTLQLPSHFKNDNKCMNVLLMLIYVYMYGLVQQFLPVRFYMNYMLLNLRLDAVHTPWFSI